MEIFIIVGIIFFIAFFLESIFGFGGLVLSFTALGFFLDIKDSVYLGLYVGMLGSIFIIMTDYKSFSKQKFMDMFLIAIIGVLIGTFFFDYFSSALLLKIFAVFLFIFSIKSIFFDNIKTNNKKIKNGLLLSGGFLQGIFGTGGPFTVLAMKDSFTSKSELRTTMAMFFIIFNIIRSIQLFVQGTFQYQIMLDYYWLAFVLFFAVYLGHTVHLKVSDKIFKTGIIYLLLFASIALFFK